MFPESVNIVAVLQACPLQQLHFPCLLVVVFLLFFGFRLEVCSYTVSYSRLSDTDRYSDGCHQR